jgi:hypothetical protein
LKILLQIKISKNAIKDNLFMILNTYVDPTWIETEPINESEVKVRAITLEASRTSLVTGDHRAGWLLKAVSCIDLTTLAGTTAP